MNWQRLDLLSQQFSANCEALASRHPQLASQLRQHVPLMLYLLAVEDDHIHLGQVAGQQVHVLPCRLDAPGARKVAAQLFPTGVCNDAPLVAGLDQGWLWQALYAMEAASPARPGYKSPLYFLASTIEQLWLACHLHDWRQMLADPRAIILVGPDAVDQLRQVLVANPLLSPPRLAVTVDPQLWTRGAGLDQLNAQVLLAHNERLATNTEKLKAIYAPVNDRTNAARLAGKAPLRILGITSRFTTFLQHSMRDWLAGFASAGHCTHLLIEAADHEQLTNLVLSEACVEFKPDLILMIDHFREGLGGLPEKVPCVMWVQDFLPNIFTPAAGAAQGVNDYVIGHARTECTTRFGYPYARFMPALVAVNEDRFAPAQLSEDDRRQYECDVCFVSHASVPAEAIVQQQIEQNPQAKALLDDAFGRLKAIYDQGQAISHPLHVRAIIDEAMLATRLTLTPESAERLSDQFTMRVNNALLRHQALEWAASTGANLHLYGNGWERHPRLGKYARGPADNQVALRKIFRAARINLQATPFGSVHQRLLEGLASGGFFLIRYIPGDALDRIYQPLWDWIVREGIESDEEILGRATPEVYALLGEFQRTVGLDPFRLGMKLIDDIRTGADLGFCRCAATLWPEYDRVAFNSRVTLQQRIGYFLSHDDERQQIAASMRRRVLEQLTYKATNARMLRFIAEDLRSRSQAQGVAA